jgi:hypothetical protein
VKNKLFIAGLGLSCGMLLAQTSPMPPTTDKSAQTNSSTNERSWVGLLVSTGCNSSTSPSTTGNSAMTGPDLNGSRGSGMNGTSNDTSGSSATAVNQASSSGNTTSDQNFPKSTASAASESSGTMNTATAPNATSNNGGPDDMEHAKMVASQLGSSCRIGADTSAFALRLPDGTIMPFDSASNAKIADQVHNRVSGNVTKIFRVEVKGTSDGNTITLDTIRM